MTNTALQLSRLALAGAAAVTLAAAPRNFPSLGNHFHAVSGITALFIALFEMDKAQEYILKSMGGRKLSWEHILAGHFVVTTALAVALFASSYFGTYFATASFVLAVGGLNSLINISIHKALEKIPPGVSHRVTVTTVT